MSDRDFEHARLRAAVRIIGGLFLIALIEACIIAVMVMMR